MERNIMTILYTHSNGVHEIKEGDPHVWVRSTLEWPFEPEPGAPDDIVAILIPLEEMTDKQLIEAIEAVITDDNEENLCLLPLFEDEKMWRFIHDWVCVDAMCERMVNFINKHVAAMAEFSQTPEEEDGFRRWRAYTSTGYYIFPWACKADDERPYIVDYATAMATMLMNQHNMERQAAYSIATAFVDYHPVGDWKETRPRDISEDDKAFHKADLGCAPTVA